MRQEADDQFGRAVSLADDHLRDVVPQIGDHRIEIRVASPPAPDRAAALEHAIVIVGNGIGDHAVRRAGNRDQLLGHVLPGNFAPVSGDPEVAASRPSTPGEPPDREAPPQAGADNRTNDRPIVSRFRAAITMAHPATSGPWL